MRQMSELSFCISPSVATARFLQNRCVSFWWRYSPDLLPTLSNSRRFVRKFRLEIKMVTAKSPHKTASSSCSTALSLAIQVALTSSPWERQKKKQRTPCRIRMPSYKHIFSTTLERLLQRAIFARQQLVSVNQKHQSVSIKQHGDTGSDNSRIEWAKNTIDPVPRR